MLEPAALAGVLEGVLAGLTCAEEAGIVHRDLKPENIMVAGDGRVKLTDFGIAKATQKVGADQFETTVGMTVGTPSYMAPEQALGEPVGRWTDLYSVGIMTWEHLVGHVPFGDTANSPTAVLLRHVNDQIPPPITERPTSIPPSRNGCRGWSPTGQTTAFRRLPRRGMRSSRSSSRSSDHYGDAKRA